MKPLTIDKNTVRQQGIKNSTSFGIKSSGLHHILGILRNQLYSDKALAVIREYTCNAVDAHTEAGCPERPIEVTFATRMQPTFKVRDFGPALTDDEISDVYAFYGESTKRNSNDQIGMLGIGSKSAFAYGDNFVINSFIDGKKHTYNAFIDPSQVGQISKLSVEDSDEENGIEIVVPVKDGDADEFVQKGKTLFEWFKVRPIVKGTSQFKYNDSKTLFSGKGWQWREGNNDRYNRGDAMVVMGNIGYPVTEYDLNLAYEDDYRNLLTENLVLTLDIGDVEISASREKLQFTEHTRKSIKKTLERVQSEIATQISKQFGECKTLFDAKCLYGSVFQTTSPLYSLRDSISKHLTWNGKKVDCSSFSCYNTAGVGLMKYKKSFRSGRYTGQEDNTIHCEKDVVVILNDVGHRRGSMGKILPLIHNEGKTPYLIVFDGYKNQRIDGKSSVSKTAKQVEKAWKSETSFDGEMLRLSELPQHKLSEFDGYQKASGGSSYKANAKHSAKCFEYDFKDSPDRSYHTKKSDFWKIAELDIENESGVYVIIDKFHIEKPRVDGFGSTQDPHRLSNWKGTLEQAGIKMPQHIYAFKGGQRDKIEGKDGWVDLFTWVAVQLSNKITDANLHQAWIDIQAIDVLHQYKEDSSRYYGSSTEQVCASLNKIERNLVSKSGTMCDYLSKYNEMRQDKDVRKTIKAVQEIAKDFGVDFKCPKGVVKSYDIKKLFIEMWKKYGMLPLVDRNTWGYEWQSKAATEITNYINVIDVCNASNSTVE